MLSLERATIFTPHEIIPQGVVIISDEGKIIHVGTRETAPSAEGERLDLSGYLLIPGLMDIHVHGGNGNSFDLGGNGLGERLGAYAAWVCQYGVTGFLCSIAAPEPDALLRLIQSYVEVLEQGLPGAEALGLHLEGPYLNPRKKGAFNPAWLYPPQVEQARAFLEAGRGWVRQITLAPELPGAEVIARMYRQAGVTVAMGHTDADYETASAALRSQFNHVTHTFNAQRGFDHRQPGALGAVLASDEVTAEVIADGVHVHAAAIRVLLRCLGVERVVLVSDAMPGAGLPDGIYDLAGNRVTLRDGKATLADGTLAGSAALLSQCVRFVKNEVGLPLNQAVQMSSLNAARAIGLDWRLGSLQAGKDASLAVIDEQVHVYLTMVKGRIVYSRLATGEMER
jgi:N-acetylglucosamine-6-phosphate deacetylase